MDPAPPPVDPTLADLPAEDVRAFLHTLLRHSPAGVAFVDPDLRYRHVNPAFAAFHGVPAERIVGRSVAETVPPHIWPVVEPAYRRARDDGVSVTDVAVVGEVPSSPGRVREWRADYHPVRDGAGAVIGIAVVVAELTDLERGAVLHREMEGRLTATLQSTPNVAVQWFDPAGRVTFWNRASEKLFGWTAGEAVGRTLDALIHTPAEFAEFRQTCTRIARTGETVGPTEYTFRRKDGSPGVCLSTLFAIPGPAGEPWFACMDVDVTELRELEHRLAHAQKMEAVGRLAGGIAHDFNNLLTVINGCSDLMLDQLAPDDPARELVHEIARGGERAGTLTRQLLAFSRRQAIAPTPLDLNATLTGAEKLLRRLIGEDILLATRLAPDLGWVTADAGQVEQVLVNLAVNARDAMPRGGRLTVETQNVPLDAGYCRGFADVPPGEYVLLAVSDTGHGMDEAVRARVFEPFFTTKPVGKGTGLGLATVHGIVKQGRGHVAVYSEVGRGTTFKVYLPRVRDAAAPRPTVRPSRTLPPGTETILLVEDEGAVRALARYTFQMCGYTVLEAADGAEAVRLAEGYAGRIHLLVSDVVMPHLGGRELAERVTAARPDCRVLFLSGYTDDAVVRHGVLAAEFAFLQKPFTPSTLAQKVRAVLDGQPA